MKKIMLLFVALATTLSTAMAATEPAPSLVTKSFTYKDFTMLSVSNSFQVKLTFAESYSIEVEVPGYLEPYLKVSCMSNKLRIGLNKLPKDIQKKLNHDGDQLHAWITMPALTALSMSGATKLETIGKPRLGPDSSLSIELSGASKIDRLEADGTGRIVVDMSGASKAELQAAFHIMDIEVSGASKLKMEGGADKVTVDCSGASNCRFAGDYGSLKAEVSGASKMEVDGDVHSLVTDISGSSRIEVDGVTDKAEMELSGASKATLTVQESLLYELSGVSTLRLRDLGAKVRGEIGRGSKIEYLK